MNSSKHEIRHSGKLISTLLWLGIPMLLIGIPAAVFVINNRPPVVNVSAPKMPDPNGYDDFVRAIGLIGIPGPASASRPADSWTTEEMDAFLVDNAACLAAVREGLRKQCMYRSKHEALFGYSEDATLRELARVLASESYCYSRAGEYSQAADSSLDAMDYGVKLPRGGRSSVMMVSLASEGIGAYSLTKVLPHLSPSELSHAAKRLECIQNQRVSFSDIMREEGNALAVSMASLYREMSKEPNVSFQDWLDEFAAPSGYKPRAPNAWRNLSYAFKNKRSMILEVRDYYHEVADAQQSPYNGRVGVPKPAGPFASIFADSRLILRMRASHCRAEAVTTMLQTEVALRRYHLDHGSCPASLKQLTPKYLKQAPIDPFGQGKPLCYKPLKNGQDFLLYSRGPNLKDDGGKDAPWNEKQGKDLVAVTHKD